MKPLLWIVSLLDKLFCFAGIHDWREMNGYCRRCGARDVILDGCIEKVFKEILSKEGEEQ
jgi:uncharacterized metal-binding protein